MTFITRRHALTLGGSSLLLPSLARRRRLGRPAR